MWTYVAKYLAYNSLWLKNYTTKTPMTGNWFLCILLIMHLGKTFFFFHSNISLKTSVLHQFTNIYANLLQSWKRHFSHICYTPSCIVSQILWFNNYIIIDNNSIHFKEFSSHNINFINQLFTPEGQFKDWNHIKREFQLNIIYITSLHKFHT